MRWLPAALMASGLTLLFVADPRAAEPRVADDQNHLVPQPYDTSARGTLLIAAADAPASDEYSRQAV
jgi:hypothetical protein